MTDVRIFDLDEATIYRALQDFFGEDVVLSELESWEIFDEDAPMMLVTVTDKEGEVWRHCVGMNEDDTNFVVVDRWQDD